MADRIILHCDCNSFFASVETALDPCYKNVPMAVCGSVEDRHGIVLAKNDIAKAYGIQTAETVYSAKRKCPDLVIASPHYDEYVSYSKRVNAIYYEYTDLVESFGIDESWLDVTASTKLFGDGVSIAESIRKRVREEIGITVSIGVSFNKVFAKLGSDYKKPDAVTVISRENYKSIVYPLPASDLLYVGKRTAKELEAVGIRNIGELAVSSPVFLTNKFGKMGEMLHLYSNGLDDSPVSSVREDAKSISRGLTFKQDISEREKCLSEIVYLSDEIGRKLRECGMKCQTVSITIKDPFLRTIQRQRAISPTDIGKEIADCAYSILQDEWREGSPIRMITVCTSNLVKREFCTEQIDMFSSVNEKERIKSRKREEPVDIIRQRFGLGSIIRASSIDTKH